MLLELGERYWALGLPAAARSALARAMAATTDAAPALRLAELALAQGDAQAARAHAAEASKRAPGPAAKLVLARAQLAAGEIAGARMTLVALLDAPALGPWDRARAHLELSRAAAALGDAAGAAAQAAAGMTVCVGAAGPRASGLEPRPNAEVPYDLIEELAVAVVAHGRADDAISETRGPRPEAGGPILAALLIARQAAGDRGVTDAAIEAALAGEAVTPALRLRQLERKARGRTAGDRAALLDAIAELDAAALAPSERARACFVHASLLEDDPATRERAEAAYRKGLAFQPGHTAAACRLALLVLERGDHAGALAEIERALRIDASHGVAWRNAARMLDVGSPSLAAVVGRLLDAANPGAGSAAGGVAPRLVTATAEVARHDVLAGVYAHGHRVKNLLGVIGSRTRSARRLAEKSDAALGARLRELETDVTALYEEWATYLRSMQAPTPTIELVAIAAVLHEVVAAAHARTPNASIAIELAPSLPDVRGDRMLLREALLNVVTNAAEACAATRAQVTLRARGIATEAAPLVEIVVADAGPGIPRSLLGRLFVPGFTTKETGSGVGLAIAERVVTAHHGRIAIDSEEGRGTTITITLPTDKAGLAALPLWTSREAGL